LLHPGNIDHTPAMSFRQIHGGIAMSRPAKDRPPLVVRPEGGFGHYRHGDVLAKRQCEGCKEPIGYDRPFWFTAPASMKVVHNVCRFR